MGVELHSTGSLDAVPTSHPCPSLHGVCPMGQTAQTRQLTIKLLFSLAALILFMVVYIKHGFINIIKHYFNAELFK